MDTTLISPPTAESRHISLAAIAGYAIAAGGLLWVLHDIDLRTSWASLQRLAPLWILPAVMFDIGSYFCQGVRWSLLLRPIGRAGPIRTTQAIYAGLFTNEIVPLRFGEAVRAYLVSRWLKVNWKDVVPSMAVERLVDAFWMAIAIGLTTLFVPLPGSLASAAYVLGAIVIVATAVFAFLVLRPMKAAAETEGRLRRLLRRMHDGLRNIGRSRQLLAVTLVSGCILLFQGLAFWCVMVAFGLSENIWAGIVVFLLVHLGTAIPNAPANVGSFQFFTVLGLTMFGEQKTVAAAFSVVVFLVLTIPLWAIGFFALTQAGETIGSIRLRIGHRE